MEDQQQGGESILGELEDQVTCWICFEVFEDPVTLPCSHSFCRDCCLKMYKKNPLCAFCRREFGLPLAATNQDLIRLAQSFKRKQRGEPEPETAPMVEQDTMWLYLPDEVVVDIFHWLSPNDLGRTSLVCQSFNRLAEDNFLWREMCLERFPFVQVSSYGNSWKRCYVARHSMQTGWESGRPGDFKVQTLRGHRNYITAFDYYRNNVVSGSADNTLKVWSTNKRNALHTLSGHGGVVNAVRFNEVRVVSASADNTIKVWDTTGGQCTHTLQQGGNARCVEFSESKIVSGGDDRNVKVWDVRSGALQHTLQGHQGPVTSLEYSGNRVISCGSDAIRVWDIRTGACLRQLVAGSPTSFQAVAGTPTVVSAETDGTVRVWNLVGGNNTHTFPGQWGRQVHSISCNGDLALAAFNNNKIGVYDVKNGTHVRDLDDHTAPVHAVQFDGQRAVSGSADNCLKVWDVKAGRRMYSLLGGSLQERSNNPPHPARPGCSFLKFDEGRIVASFNSLLRVYSFTGEAVEK